MKKIVITSLFFTTSAALFGAALSDEELLRLIEGFELSSPIRERLEKNAELNEVYRKAASYILLPLRTPASLSPDHFIETAKRNTPSKQLRGQLVSIAEQLDAQERLMPIISQIEQASSSYEKLINEQFENEHLGAEADKTFDYLLSDSANNIPRVVALKLQFKSEWMGAVQEGRFFSENFLNALRNSEVSEYITFADYYEIPRKKRECHDRLRELVNSLIAKFQPGNPLFGIKPIEFLKEEVDQPCYFALKIFSFVHKWEAVRGNLENDEWLREFVLLYRNFIQVYELYREHKPQLDNLKAHIKSEIDRLMPSFIDDIIKRQQAQLKPGKKKQAGRGRSKKAGGRQSSGQTVAAASSSTQVLESESQSSVTRDSRPAKSQTQTKKLTKTSAAIASSSGSHSAPSSSTDCSISAAPIVHHKQAADLQISETESTVRIRDEKNAMTLELFKPEKPNAVSIQKYIRTENVKNWLTNSQDALRKFGYLDPEHKNFTPEKINRVRMEQYHGFSSNADKFVSKCGISREYLKPDGQVHIMICMPGVLYFVDGTHQLGIFTYLIDPKTNQLYHRMFHPCSGDKIVKEFTAYGYWNIDLDNY